MMTHQLVNKSVGIIGCGWLGKALAISLLEQGIDMLATSSQLENVKQLNQQGIKANQLVLPATTEQLARHKIFAQHALVIAITPKFKQGRTDYAEKIAQLVAAATKKGKVQRIILLSSTAIYTDLVGRVDEASELSLTLNKVSMLHKAEQAVLSFNSKGTVIRLAGLVGPERHPGKFILANKTLSNATAPVNLIHQQDAVGLIESLLNSGNEQGVFNGVSDTHVNKQNYYQVAATALGLAAPIFSPTDSNQRNRVVSGDKVKQILKYKFTYPDLLSWL